MKRIRFIAMFIGSLMTMCFGGEVITVSAENSMADLTEFASEFSSSALYSSQDINRDGDVDIADSIFLNKCLLGSSYIANNAVLDADGNSIVSVADANCVLSGAVHNTFINRVEGTSTMFSSFMTSTIPTTNKTKSQSYLSYNYQSNTESQYSLHLKETNLNVSTLAVDMPGIIGDDSRIADAIDGIVYLSTGGTGFIVGDHVIATSAHCVYGHSTKEWLSDLKVYLPDKNGKATRTPLYAIEAHIPKTYTTNNNDKYDYALITVSEDLSDRYHFNLGMPYDIYTNTDFGKYTIYSTGYSQYLPNGDTNSYPTPQMYTGEGKIVKGSSVDKNLVCFDTDITYGNSGGPVYVKETYRSGSNAAEERLTVISICSGIYNYTTPHYNMGPTMDAIMLKFFLSNPHISY